MLISSDIIQKLLPLLRPLMEDENQRRGYLMRALGMDAPVLRRLVWNTPVDVFITVMVKELVVFGEITPGKPALCALLEVIREDVGEDRKVSVDELLRRIREELKQPEQPPIQNNSVQTLTGHSDAINSVAISPDGQIVASGSRDYTIKLWNLPRGELLSTLTGHTSAVMSLAFSPDGITLASASNLEFHDGNIKLWDVGTARLRQTLGGSLLALRTSSVAFSPDGQTLASGHFDATIKLWHLGSGEVRRTLRGHGWDVNSVTFSRDGRLLVSGGVDGAIMIWNWRTGERILTLNRPSDLLGSFVSWLDRSIGTIWSVTISPDGQTIASGGSDQPIKLWNSGTGKLLRILTEHSGAVRSVAFSPDGKILASGGDDNTMRIWNFHTGELLQTFKHLGSVNSVTFSSDGQTLVSGSDDTTIKVWRVCL